ncbi:hypothetical protein BJ741DRAFT_184040 [Chytriomyces cf. hyalinus JEL632]|nr:hypothetical protein BJ741DRAFT_184040 [Chytriomyces cf. hyalinus JEL632]
MHFSSAVIAIAAFVSGISAQTTPTPPSQACQAALSKFSTLMQQCALTGGSAVDSKQAQCVCTDASIATFNSFATECATFMPAGYSGIVDQLKTSCAQLTGKKSGSSAVHFGIAAGAIAAALL